VIATATTEKELEIARAQAREQKKPDAIIEKIAT